MVLFNNFLFQNNSLHTYGLFTFTDPYSGSDSDPIPVLSSWDWNLNPSLQCEKF